MADQIVNGESGLSVRNKLNTLFSYAKRTTAEAATVPITVDRISVKAATGETLWYKRDANGTALTTADGANWSPDGDIFVDHFGAVATGDCATIWEAAMDYLEGLGGGLLNLLEGKTYHATAITHASNVTLRMNKGTLAVHSSMAKTGDWYTNRDINTVSASRDCDRPEIIGPGTFDGSARPFDRWLSKADGTAVTDPEADYVMGTGALASGISGVNLTAVLTGNEVTSVTITNGGSGWNGHPTFPYVPTTVPLKFTGGGGSGAAGYGTISGGTITSVTITQGGSGYTSAPTVATLGGYADIALLADPSVDRRNPNYDLAGNGVNFVKANYPKIDNVKFTGFRCRVLSESGNFKPHFRGITFENCGKKDGPFHCIWSQSYGTPSAPGAFYADSEDVTFEDITAVTGIERSAILFAPTKGGTLRNLTAKGCGESAIYIPPNLNYNGGRALIEGCTLSDNVLTDIAAQLIEHAGVTGLTVRDCRLSGASISAVAAQGCTRVIYEGNRFSNNCTALTTTGDKRYPYGPYSERYDFNAGQRPIAGTALHIPSLAVAEIGSLGATGGSGTKFSDNIFTEARAEYPSYVFKQTKSGSNSIAGDCTIEGNDLIGIPSGMGLLGTSVGTVWQTTMPLHIRGNLGHASEAPVIVTYQITGTGTFTITPGFRPSRVEAYADVNNAARLRASHGAFAWARNGVRNDFVHYFAAAEDAAAERGAILSNFAVYVVDPATGTVSTSAAFVSWTETGFTLNCANYFELTNVRFVCHP